MYSFYIFSFFSKNILGENFESTRKVTKQSHEEDLASRMSAQEAGKTTEHTMSSDEKDSDERRVSHICEEVEDMRKNDTLEEVTIQLARLTLKRIEDSYILTKQKVATNIDIIYCIRKYSNLLSITKCALVCKQWNRVFAEETDDNKDYVCFRMQIQEERKVKEDKLRDKQCNLCFMTNKWHPTRIIQERFIKMGYCAKCEKDFFDHHYYPKGDGWVLVKEKRFVLKAVRLHVAMKIVGIYKKLGDENGYLHYKNLIIHEEKGEIKPQIEKYIQEMRDVLEYIICEQQEFAIRKATTLDNIVPINEKIIQNLTQEEFIRYYSLIIKQISEQNIKGQPYQKGSEYIPHYVERCMDEVKLILNRCKKGKCFRDT